MLPRFTPIMLRVTPVMLRVTPVMLRVTPVMLRAVAASRKSPWNDLNRDILDSATGAHNDGVRLTCSFRYAVVLARLPCRRYSFDRISFDRRRYRTTGS